MGEAANVICGELAAFNARDRERVKDSFIDDCPKVVPGGELRGGAEILGWCEAMWEAFPDAHVTCAAVAEQGSVAAIEGTCSGTHLGTLRTPNGPIPPTGRPMEFKFSEYAVAHGGVIVSARLYFDQLGVLEQLGVAPAATPV